MPAANCAEAFSERAVSIGWKYARCDLTEAEFRRTQLRGVSFADSDIRGLRVGEVASFELAGLKVNALQAVELARLLGVEIDDGL